MKTILQSVALFIMFLVGSGRDIFVFAKSKMLHKERNSGLMPIWQLLLLWFTAQFSQMSVPDYLEYFLDINCGIR